MRLILSLILLVLIVFLGIQLYGLWNQRASLSQKAEEVGAQTEALKAENEKLTADLGYFSNFDNLVKELKSLFNYRKPGEKLIIIVPKEGE